MDLGRPLLEALNDRGRHGAIARLGRDPAWADRLVGVALNALAQGVTPVHFAAGIAAALRFDYPDAPSAGPGPGAPRRAGGSRSGFAIVDCGSGTIPALRNPRFT